MALAGVKDFPEDAMTNIIIKQMRLQHPNLTVNEINLAFELNAAGLLGERIKAFNNFDLEFVMSVLENYKQKRIEARKELERGTPQLPEHIPTNQEMYEGLLEMIAKDGIPQFYNWNAVFWHMEDIGKIKMTVEQKQEQFKEVAASMKEGRLSDALNGHSISDENFTARVKTECRRLMVIKNL